jgi:hypothetical protein
VPLEWAATSLMPSPDKADHAAHIMLGDVVRVVRGPHQYQTGQVKDKHGHSTSFSLIDMKTNNMVSLPVSMFPV